jgi:hypothetical protein
MSGGPLTGHDFEAAQKLHSLLPDAGFTNVTIQWQNWPVGQWAKGTKNKRIGRWWAEDMKEVCRNAGAMFTRVLGWSQDEFDVLAANVRREIDSGEKHM